MRWPLALLLLLLYAVPSFAGDDQVGQVYGRERFVEAIRAYRAGDHDKARAFLTTLLNDPSVADRDLRVAARVYLGEILLADGNRQAAWDAFRAILVDEPEHRLDPYEHPPDVVEFFETVRAATMAMGPDAPPPPDPQPQPPAIEPLPTGAYLGFGLHQLRHGRILAGSLFAAGEAGLLAGTFATGIPLYLNHESVDPDEIQEFKRARAVNWTLGGAFAVLWAVGVSEASLQWKSEQRKNLEDWQRTHASSELTLTPMGVGWEVRF